jgi:hypothetical protein
MPHLFLSDQLFLLREQGYQLRRLRQNMDIVVRNLG